MRRINHARADLVDLLQAAPRLVVVWMLLPVTGINRLRRRRAEPKSNFGSAEAFEAGIWRRRALALRRIGARLPGCHCLARSIALSNWLNRAGCPNTLKIGITGTAATLKSHSWVEFNGQILDDSPENIARFTKITEI